MKMVKLLAFVFLMLSLKEPYTACAQTNLNLSCNIHVRYLSSRSLYYVNSSSTFQIELIRASHSSLPSLTSPLSGDIETNPGPESPNNNGAGGANRKRNVTCVLLNARSIRNKGPELESYIATRQPDIVCVTETWLNNHINDSVLGIPDDYIIFRRDRGQNQRGGGILVAIHASLSPVILTTLAPDNLELLWFSIKANRESWIIGLLYRQPSSNALFWERLHQNLTSIDMELYDACMVLGDFNVDMNPHGSNVTTRKRLLDVTNDFGLYQMVSEVTRPSDDNAQGGSIIDLLFTNRPDWIHSVNTIPSPVDSDHLALEVCLRSHRTAPRRAVVREFLDTFHGDFEHLRNIMHYIPWSAFMNPNDPNESAEIFMDLLDAAIHDSIPQKTKRKTKNSPWVTPALKKLIIKKHRLFKKAKRSTLDLDWCQYKVVRNDVKKQTRKLYWDYVNNMFSSNDNRRRFWSFVSKKKQNAPPPKFIVNNSSLSQPSEISNAFNDMFSLVFNPSGSVSDEPPSGSLPIPQLSSIQVQVHQVGNRLLQLSASKAPGPDGVLPVILKNCALEISYPLVHLFNISLNTGKLPDSWRRSNITPVFKKGDRSIMSNYRPVALTSVICKVLEQIVSSSILEHVETFGLLNPNQHGFTQKRSCVTQLINVLQAWCTILDKNRPPRVDAAFLDMSKAFDKMPHHILLSKLSAQFNVTGTLWKWIKSFLVGRIQRVIFQGSSSPWVDVTSGVPQGSCLGPLLFNLFINDISLPLSSKSVMFADDILMFRTVQSPNDEERFQTDLQLLHEWAELNQMTFNPSKCKILHVTRSRNLQPPIYKLNTSDLSCAPSYVYLGVTICANLQWNTHIDNIVKRANRLLGFIRVVAGQASTQAIFSLYKALILPILEYGCPAWHPHTLKQEQQLERVQRAATRIALKQRRGDMSYEDRLTTLHWSSLSSRRDYLLLSFTFKCLSGLTLCEALTESTLINSRRQEVLTFRHLPSRTQALFLSPSRRFPRLWNNLPTEIKDNAVLNSISSFLSTLKQSLLTVH